MRASRRIRAAGIVCAQWTRDVVINDSATMAVTGTPAFVLSTFGPDRGRYEVVAPQAGGGLGTGRPPCRHR